MPTSAPTFAVITGAQAHRVLSGQEDRVVDLVEAAYRLHGAGGTVNPPSYFLRFPDRPDSRIIALPASVGGADGVDGLKWVSSFPANIRSGLPRASAALLLNDPSTGYPYACLEASIISAVRTAASAALAARALARNRATPRRLGIVGAGLIARYVHTYLARTGWEFDEIAVHDRDPGHAEAFRGLLRESTGSTVVVRDRVEDLLTGSDLVVFATTAGTPHVHDPALLAHAPLVLHVSLRDLSPEIVLQATNVVDDVEHCLKAETSVHLAEQRVGHRRFLAGTLTDVLTGDLTPDPDTALVFSPFGLGVLDLVVGRHVHRRLSEEGDLHVVDDFFVDLDRYAAPPVAARGGGGSPS